MYEKENFLCIELDNQVVARGYIVVTELTTTHEVLLGASTYRVAVKTTLDLEARLPILIVDEIVYIKDVVDTMVPWPKHLVFLSIAKVKIILL